MYPLITYFFVMFRRVVRVPVLAATCGILTITNAQAGIVFSFGSNKGGQTGQGTEAGDTLTATTIDMTNLIGQRITQIAAGEQYGLLLSDSGQVFAFGHSDFGETGLGVEVGSTPIAAPIDLTNLAGRKVSQVASGLDHSLLLAEDGTVFAFGSNRGGQTGLGTAIGNTTIATPIDTLNIASKSIIQIAAGGQHSLLLADDGSVFSFGSNLDGTTGIGLDVGDTLIATEIDTTYLAGRTVTQITAGVTHNLLLTDDGSLFSFGLNDAGRTGQGIDTGNTLIATSIDATNLSGKAITKIAAGFAHNLLLDEDGVVYGFGFNNSGQVGIGDTENVLTAEQIDTSNLSGASITQLASGGNHSLLLANDGTVFSFGSNANGRTGLGTIVSNTLAATPIDMTNLSGLHVTGISAGTASLLLAVPEPPAFALLVLAVLCFTFCMRSDRGCRLLDGARRFCTS